MLLQKSSFNVKFGYPEIKAIVSMMNVIIMNAVTTKKQNEYDYYAAILAQQT